MSRAQNCQVEGCKRPYRAKGYCQIHFRKWRRGGLPKKPRYKTCGEENCYKPLYRFGWCQSHQPKATAAPKETPAKEAVSKEEAPAKE